MKIPLELQVNGRTYQLEVEPGARLLDVLRKECRLTGTKEGCGVGECGSCSVLVDGRVECSCLLLAHSMAGRKITTIEGLSVGMGLTEGIRATGKAYGERGLAPGREYGATPRLHPIQEAFIEVGACQCGFCIPGMIIAAKALLDEHPNPSDEEIAQGLSGNLCRCTGYAKIFEAVRLAATRIEATRIQEAPGFTRTDTD